MKNINTLTFTSSSTALTKDHAMKVLLQDIIPSCDRVAQSQLYDFSVFHQSKAEARRRRYSKAAQLVDSWLSEDSDYDVRVSEQLERELKERIKLGTPK